METVYFMAVRNILQPLGIFYGFFVYFMMIWYIFTALVCYKKSGNPD
jgi:hypothetical protein